MRSFSLVLALVSFALGGCAAPQVRVQQHGRMHDVLSSSKPEALPTIAIDDVLDRPGAHGVGALAGRDGEITIHDGQVWVARVSDGGLAVQGPSTGSSERAALLTVARVDSWREIPIGTDLADEDLERFVGDRAEGLGIDSTKPFPFVIEGNLTDLEMHVIHGRCPMRPGVRLAANEQPWRHSIDRPTHGTIVGFYAPDSVGNLTHPGTSMHMHALLDVDGRTATGHVERLAVGKGAVLKLPAAP
jgi:acetolactate decarboxylase